MTYGDMPSNPAHPTPNDAKKLILHTFLMIKGNKIMFSDVFPGTPFMVGNNVSISIVSEDVEELKTYFNNLKENGTVMMDLQETFWSKAYGMLTDQFGVVWLFNHKENQ